jgi:hypothetical protein
MHPVNLIKRNDPSTATSSAARNHAARCAEEAEPDKQTKEKVREYMERRGAERRQNSRAPLHDPEAIRKEIGWDMVDRRKGDRRK